MTDIEPQGQHHGGGHETTDVKARGILVFAIALVVVAAVIQGVLGLWSDRLSGEEERAIADQPRRFRDESGQFPSPRLQGNPAVDMARFRRQEEERLSGYGWVDREAGIAHIPIDRAIDALVKQGLPTRDAPAGAP